MEEQKTKAADEKFCESCGAVIKQAAEICPKCGVRQRKPVSSQKSKIVAGVLGICLGGIGIHKFYLGQGALGVVYILFCWTFIPAIIGFIEGIIYLTMEEDKFNEKYNS